MTLNTYRVTYTATHPRTARVLPARSRKVTAQSVEHATSTHLSDKPTTIEIVSVELVGPHLRFSRIDFGCYDHRTPRTYLVYNGERCLGVVTAKGQKPGQRFRRRQPWAGPWSATLHDRKRPIGVAASREDAARLLTDTCDGCGKHAPLTPRTEQHAPDEPAESYSLCQPCTAQADASPY